MKNQSNFILNNRDSSEIIGNPQFANPFDQGIRGIKQEIKIGDKQSFSSKRIAFEGNSNQKSKIDFQGNSNKKSNKIKQAKQLLAQRLKQVTTLKFEEPQHSQNQYFPHQLFQNKKIQPKKIDCHMNPIFKLTNQPFVRSKTCDELRKQHSLKKMRKKNYSATKYNTPHSTQCHRQAQSTGLNSKDVYQGQSGWLQSGQMKVETREFALDPFSNSMIETFDQGQIKKLSNQLNKKKLKAKLVSANKIISTVKQEPIPTSQIKYPFRINSAFNQTNQGNKSPNNFENSKNFNSSSSDLLMNEFRIDSSKFTPRLERYPGLQRRESPSQNKNFEKISIKTYRQQFPKDELTNQQNWTNNKNKNSVYSEEQSGGQERLEYSPNPSSDINLEIRASNNHNELVTNLHMTNTILEEKLRIKEMEIEQLNRNYFKLKTELLHTKNMQNKNIRYPQESHHIKFQTSLNNQRYLTNLQVENNFSGVHQNRSHEFVNQSHEIESLPSPKFCDGVEEQFARQRYVEPEKIYQRHVFQYSEQKPQKPQSIQSKFAKKKQLFSSDMSEKISEEFDSEEIYMPTNYEPEYSNVSKKYVFKKSNFKDNNSAKFHNDNRDSLVYTLGQQKVFQSSSKKNISVSDLPCEKPVSSNAISQEMLLEPITQSINESGQKIDLLSPIKSHSTQKAQNGSFRSSFRTSRTKSQNRVLDDSMRKFDYYLTPQKDENTMIKNEDKEENEGLFEKAFSSLRKKKDSADDPSQFSESHRYSSSSIKKQQAIDPIIEHNIQ